MARQGWIGLFGLWALLAALNVAAESPGNKEELAPHAIISGPTAAPSPAIQNRIVELSAISNGVTPVTWVWDLGNGLTDTTGPRIQHTYTATGTYLISATATDARGQVASASIVLVVDPEDCGCGGPGLTANPMQVKSLAGAANFKVVSMDTATVSGIIPDLPTGFAPAQKTVMVEIGGAMGVFVLDEKGKAKAENGSATLKFKGAKRNSAGLVEFKGGPVPYKITIQGGTWSDDWLDEGVKPNEDADKTTLTFKVNITVNNTLFSQDVPVSYSAKAGKGGKYKTK